MTVPGDYPVDEPTNHSCYEATAHLIEHHPGTELRWLVCFLTSK